MKLKGFTLAEVLVAISIIGIVAMMTLPALNTNIQRQQVGPLLLRAIATLETANAIYAQENDILNFGNTCNNYASACFVNGGIARRIGAVQVNVPEYDVRPWGALRPQAFDTKNGFAYIMNDRNIYIDVNGTTRGPNMFGRDLFYTVMDSDGKIFPFGSRVKLNDNDPTWENGNCDSSRVANIATCAGSIVDNGGRVIYPW